MSIDLEKFHAEMARRYEFWRTCTNDPYGISVACMAAAGDVMSALAAAKLTKKAKPAAKRTKRTPQPPLLTDGEP
jgi:hypothetical protein